MKLPTPLQWAIVFMIGAILNGAMAGLGVTLLAFNLTKNYKVQGFLTGQSIATSIIFIVMFITAVKDRPK